VKVEQALHFLPDLESVMPLRAELLASSEGSDRAAWTSAGAYLTVGKRNLSPDAVRQRLPQLVRAVADHVAAVYNAYADALDGQERGDLGVAVASLLRAGRLEEYAGRLRAARGWYEVALGVAEALQDRRPEVEALLAIGAACVTIGAAVDGARAYQRGLALAESEFDQDGAIAACEGLGRSAFERGEWAGAQAWMARGLRLAEASGDPVRVGRLHRRLGVLADRQGDLVSAGDHLRRAREAVEPSGDAREMARILDAQGVLDARGGRADVAIAAYREALAWTRRREPDPALETRVRLHLAELLLATDRALEAEDEMRRAEQLAIGANLTARLVQIYTLMGAHRGRLGDETGFVFFEQAMTLCHALERSPALEAEVCYEYGVFKHHLGQQDEARAYLERARELYEGVGGAATLERVRAELEQLTA
jgi:tetratricopeptide (TPR) repeat protein